MNERTISLSSMREQYNATYASLGRACDDLQAAGSVVEQLDPFLPDFQSGRDMLINAAILRSQAASALKAAFDLSAAASSFEALACVVSSSVAQAPAAEAATTRTSSVPAKAARVRSRKAKTERQSPRAASKRSVAP